MKFNDYPDLFHFISQYRADFKKAGPRAFYEYLHRGSAEDRTQATSEMLWLEAKRPYYNVWPGIVRGFERLDLSRVPASAIAFPEPFILFRFPESSRVGRFEAEGREWWLKSVLAGCPPSSLNAKTGKVMEGKKVLVAFMDIGEVYTDEKKGPIVQWRKFPLTEVYTVGRCLEIAKEVGGDMTGVVIPEETIQLAFQIITACSLLEQDSELLVPDVLKRDKDKFDPENPDQRMVERAHRNGKVGWNVGESVEPTKETNTHFRDPHPALYWTGPGRKKPVVRIRRGKGPGGSIIVHRDKMSQVPTGHLDEEE